MATLCRVTNAFRPDASHADAVVRPFWAVEEEVAPGHSFEQVTPRTLILLTQAGFATSLVDGHRFDHAPGSLLVLGRESHLQETVKGDHPWHVRFLLFLGPWADACEHKLRNCPARAIFFSKAPLRLQRLFREMIETALMKVGAWEWPFMARLSEILGSLEMATFKPVESIVDRVDRLLSQGADWAWTVEELASSMKLSPRALTLQMKALTGEAPGHYIRKYRISAATRLLAMGLNVRETADRLGFANPYHFSRLYKEVTGESPSTAADRLAKEVGRSPLH